MIDARGYQERGFLLCEGLIPRTLIDSINTDVDRVLERARSLSASDDVLDLEPTHRPESPRVRRLKYADRHCATIRELLKQTAFKEVVTSLLGPNVRLQTSKLNMKEADGGAAVEWHQDWAFYPHTNDDVLAAGVMLDDVDDENGPLLLLPESHRGPIFDHMDGGVFCGAIDVERSGLRLDQAVSLTGGAGSVSFHHVRTVHGSDVNRTTRRRRILFIELTAADAWPLAGGHAPFTDLEEFDSRLIYGEGTVQPRMEPVPLRMPLPRPKLAGSIYEVQSHASKQAFGRRN